MRISKKTWHYRFLNFLENGGHWGLPSMSICQYFWKLVGYFAAMLFILLILAAIVVGFILIPKELGIAFGVLFGAIAVIFCIVGTCEYYKNKRFKKGPGVISLWYTAHKEKWCPIIEFYDPDEEKQKESEKIVKETQDNGVESGDSKSL